MATFLFDLVIIRQFWCDSGWNYQVMGVHNDQG